MKTGPEVAKHSPFFGVTLPRFLLVSKSISLREKEETRSAWFGDAQKQPEALEAAARATAAQQNPNSPRLLCYILQLEIWDGRIQSCPSRDPLAIVAKHGRSS